ncbi:MAG: dTDP-4-amino-4,6-dideoxygalactose transaminase [Planctomycetota bacterium]
MDPRRVDFNLPQFVGGELENISRALEARYLAGNGEFGRRCEALLEAALGARRVLLTTSCTHALEMAGLLLDLEPGDEVIVPAYTFVSTVNAFALRAGVRPVFCDVREDTLNLDEAHLARLIGPRTRAVVPVHYAGVAVELDRVLELCGDRVAVVEDNAHGLFGRYHGRALGTFGRLAALSFHETKNFICGEGGALIVNDPSLVQRAEIIREKGTNRARFFRGEVDRYTWVGVGSSYVLSDVLAAILLAQLEARDRIQASRAAVWTRYQEGLAPWAEALGVRQPIVPSGVEQSYHLYYLLLPTPEQRTRLLAHLRARGIHGVFHYQPLHLSEMGRGYGGRPGDCPVTESVCDRLVRLPFHTFMQPEAQDQVIAAVNEFLP